MASNEKHSSPILAFTPRGDANGWLIALQERLNVPFDIQRAYYIFATQAGVTRGKHAHRELRQLAVCVAGKCRFQMYDGVNRSNYILDRPDVGIMIEPMIWHEMNDFSSDCVLLVLASGPYDERDYIRDLTEFEQLANATQRELQS